MAELKTVFATTIYRADLADAPLLLPELDAICRSLAEDDQAGRAWCRKHGYPGYTSYSSLADLPWRFPVFRSLVKQLDRHVGGFAKALEYDLGRRRLTLDGIWVNVLPEGGFHAAHIHPLSVVSGTFYVATPAGASALKFEDPRLGLMMAAPPRKPKAAPERQSFVYEAPRPGTLLLWESWLRHEVPRNTSKAERISISFNYRW
jgi:uncharacterized protein (TIGR02466 family)